MTVEKTVIPDGTVLDANGQVLVSSGVSSWRSYPYRLRCAGIPGLQPKKSEVVEGRGLDVAPILGNL